VQSNHGFHRSYPPKIVTQDGGSRHAILALVLNPVQLTAANRTGGIGYSVYFYATRIFPVPEFKLLAIEGLTPEYGTLSSEAYPITTQVYAVLNSTLGPSHPARQLSA